METIDDNDDNVGNIPFHSVNEQLLGHTQLRFNNVRQNKRV